MPLFHLDSIVLKYHYQNEHLDRSKPLKYLCLCYYEPEKVANLTPAEGEAIPAACKPHDDALKASGKMELVGSHAEPNAWKSIRPVDGKPVITDGPFHASNEQAGAFFVVEADSIEAAVEIASMHPSARLGHLFGGGIEVLPCESYEVWEGG